MDNLILNRCKYCDKTYEGTSESCCCSELCNIKYQKYMKQREKTKKHLEEKISSLSPEELERIKDLAKELNSIFSKIE